MTDKEEFPVDSGPGAVVPATFAQPHQSKQWVLWSTIAVTVILFLTLGLWFIARQQQQIDTMQTRISQQNETISDLTDKLVGAQENAQKLYNQIISLGEAPQGAPPSVVTGPTGDQGLPGLNGVNGKDGKDGAPGAPGTDGLDGKNGVDGANGTNGTNGLDGKNGSDGAPGATGATGPQGPPGPVCPENYTLTTVWLLAADSETGTPALKQAAICQPTTTPTQ